MDDMMHNAMMMHKIKRTIKYNMLYSMVREEDLVNFMAAQAPPWCSFAAVSAEVMYILGARPISIPLSRT
jgi:hypothetical protein